MKLQQHLLAFAVISLMAIPSFGTAGFAGGLPQTVSEAARARAKADADYKFVYSDWTWANEKWTGDDDAFAEARMKIDTEFKNVNDPVAAAMVYKNAAADNPHSALEQFRWAYACYSAASSKNANGKPPVDTGQSLVALARATQPHCYNYDRLRFLLMSGWPQERGLAERLLNRDPNDVPVKFRYATILAVSKDSASRDKAVQIAQRLVAAGRDLPRCYFLLGFVYNAIAFERHDPVYGRKAITANNQFLAAARSDDQRRDVVTRVNSYLEQQMKKWQ